MVNSAGRTNREARERCLRIRAGLSDVKSSVPSTSHSLPQPPSSLHYTYTFLSVDLIAFVSLTLSLSIQIFDLVCGSSLIVPNYFQKEYPIRSIGPAQKFNVGPANIELKVFKDKTIKLSPILIFFWYLLSLSLSFLFYFINYINRCKEKKNALY